MKQKNLSELREAILTNISNENKEKIAAINLYQKALNLEYSNGSNKNDELVMRKKIFNLSNRLNGSNIIPFKKAKEKINLKLLFHQQNNYKNNDISNSNDMNHLKKNNLFLMNKNDNKNINHFLGNSNLFNKHTDLSLRGKKHVNEAKLFSFFDNNKDNINNNNIYPIRKDSEEKKHKILLKNDNKNINYRKHLLNEKIDVFNFNINKNMNNINNINENKNDIKKSIKIDDMKHKGLFYLYNLQNNIYKQNRKIKNLNYLSLNTFNQKGNNNINITQIPKKENSYSNKPIIAFPKSFYNNNSSNKKTKYNTINNNKKNSFNLDNIFLNSTNRIRDEKNIFHSKIEFRKQNVKNKYFNIFTQNESNPNSKRKIKIDNINNNLLTDKNLAKTTKKIKLKLRKAMGNNKTENLFKNKTKEIKDYTNILLNNANINNNKKKEVESKNDINNFNQYSNRNNKLNNSINESKVNNNSLNNISEISKKSTALKDSKYYMNKCLSLINYIKKYYEENKSYPETKINFYLYGRRIGQGAFGKVNIGLNILTGRVVAIKSFKKTPIEKLKHKMIKIQYETELMKRFNHKNITKILEVFNDEEYMLIIMEYINGGNLFSFVKKRRKLSEKMAKFLFRQIILGIQHIHSKNVVHRDIKLENLLIDFNNNVKICDFGIGRVLNSEDEILYDKCGTPMYMAPEIILANKEKGYKGFPVDIWSSGITLYIMLSGNLPFNLKNKKEKKENISLNSIKNHNNSYLQNQIINFNPKEIENISEEAHDLLKGILNKDPTKRLNCAQILNHPWLKHSNDFSENKNTLFTKAEMTMMSKTYIDYRKGEIEDLKENFTLSNLRNDEIKLEEKNITTKSSILDPFNSCVNKSISSSDDSIESDSFDDFKNVDIRLENDIMIFNNKVKEFNLNFEVNNNHEVDNGIIIKTHSEFSNSSIIKDSFTLTDKNEEKNKNENNNNSLSVDLNILDEIEKFGYDKGYVLECVENNILCHPSTVFYLLKNYRDIE